jgi:hypothetical protein
LLMALLARLPQGLLSLQLLKFVRNFPKRRRRWLALAFNPMDLTMSRRKCQSVSVTMTYLSHFLTRNCVCGLVWGESGEDRQQNPLARESNGISVVRSSSSGPQASRSSSGCGPVCSVVWTSSIFYSQ